MPKTKIFFFLTLCSVVSCHPSGNGLGIIPRSGGIDVVMIKQEQNKGKFCFDRIDVPFSSTSLMQCQDKCKQNTACVGISYSPSHKWCYLCPTLENIRVCTICNPHERYEWDNYEISKLVATDGTDLEKSSKNADCCSTNSILGSEDGSTWRSPLVSSHGGTGELLCNRKRKHTFAQWINMAAKMTGKYGIKGICYKGWMYQ